MKNAAAVRQYVQTGGFAFGTQCHRTPTDFLARPGEDALAEGACHKLAAEANPKRGTVLPQTALRQRDLTRKEPIGIAFVDADRSAQHNQQIGVGYGSLGPIIDRGIAV
jgi:hypothetical protein